MFLLKAPPMSEDRSDEIAGQPILMVRRLLLQGLDGAWDTWLVRYVLGVDQPQAEHIIEELEKRGYIERVPSVAGEKLWESSIAGQILAQVTQIKPMPRAAVERKLQELLAKIKTVNEDPYFLYRIKRALVYGSFLTDAASLNELNIAVTLMPKDWDVQAQSTLEKARIIEAKAKGRSFASPVKEFDWPREEAIVFLQSRSRILKVVFEERADLSKGQRTLFEE
jgi:hypothetical protein